MNINYSLFKSRTFYSAVVLVAYNFFTAIVPVFPNVAWIGTVVNLLGIIAVSYFHVSGISNAVTSSLTLGSPQSGQ